jgi:hypothetical protein
VCVSEREFKILKIMGKREDNIKEGERERI